MLIRLSRALHRISSVWTIGLAIMVYGYFLAVVMPEEGARSQTYAGDWGTPDSRFFFNPDDLYRQIALWGEAGRAQYISFRIGLDIVWALVYTAFLVTVTSVALRRAFAPNHPQRKLNLIALIPLLSDYSENTLGIIIASNFPDRLDALAWLASGVTSVKWISLSAAHLVMLYALGMAIRNWRQPQLPRNR